MKIRLNGWQRIWVILSSIYLLLGVSVTILFWPTPETTYHRNEFITLMPAKLREKVEGAYRSSYEREEAWRKKAASPVGFIPDPVEFPNGALLDVRAAEQEGDAERVAAAYWAVVESATRAERWTGGWWG